MKFMTLWRPAGNPTPPEGEMMQLIEEMTKNGVLVSTGGWDPHGPSTMLKASHGKVSITDGPFTETKELIAGFAILKVNSKEEALAWSTRFMKLAGDGSCEMREFFEHPQAT